MTAARLLATTLVGDAAVVAKGWSPVGAGQVFGATDTRTAPAPRP